MVFYWLRRDLRLTDNRALSEALKSGIRVQPVFIFDSEILGRLPKRDLRVQFLWEQLEGLNAELAPLGSSVWIVHGRPADVWKDLFQQCRPKSLYFNRDYEPYARERDSQIRALAESLGIAVFNFKDHVIFEPDEVLKPDGSPYSVFTPYSKRWKALLKPENLKDYFAEENLKGAQFYQQPLPEKGCLVKVKTLGQLGFEETEWVYPIKSAKAELIQKYEANRNFPAIQGTSMLGLHFRFGTISIRKAVKAAMKLSETWANELIWREFFQMILWHYPETVDRPFRPRYATIEWRNNEREFEAWKQGQTGYPMVDAGMRELNATGYMHNRVRMITASFLVKHLLIDWRWGERYFAEKLLDFELASNVGNWQWAAGCGTDAAPYFRVFNPQSQAEKFDSKGVYVKKWVPDAGSSKYPAPIVEHKMARLRALEVYGKALKDKSEKSL